jgi:hypothetical protein
MRSVNAIANGTDTGAPQQADPLHVTPTPQGSRGCAAGS